MKVLLQRWAGLTACAVLVGCGGGSDPSGGSPAAVTPQATAGTATQPGSSGGTPAAASADNTAQRLSALQGASVPLPSGTSTTLNAGSVANAVQSAQAMSGSRGAFEDFHQNVSPLLPSTTLASTLGATASGTVKALQLAAVQNDIICVIGDNNVVVNDPNNCIIVVNPPPPPPPNNCPVVCATACAQADAKAFAQAWAHASATACAWAQAWACVYNGVFPFNRVCAWAQSQACFTAFASAFGVGWAWESERRCRKECSDGRVWEWFERPKLAGN